MSKILSYFDTEAFAVFYKTSTVHDRQLHNVEDQFREVKDAESDEDSEEKEYSYKRRKPVYLWLEKFMPAVYQATLSNLCEFSNQESEPTVNQEALQSF